MPPIIVPELFWSGYKVKLCKFSWFCCSPCCCCSSCCCSFCCSSPPLLYSTTSTSFTSSARPPRPSVTVTIIFTVVATDEATHVVWDELLFCIDEPLSAISQLYDKLSPSGSVASTHTSTVELQITGFSDTVIEFITGLWFWLEPDEVVVDACDCCWLLSLEVSWLCSVFVVCFIAYWLHVEDILRIRTSVSIVRIINSLFLELILNVFNYILPLTFSLTFYYIANYLLHPIYTFIYKLLKLKSFK